MIKIAENRKIRKWAKIDIISKRIDWKIRNRKIRLDIWKRKKKIKKYRGLFIRKTNWLKKNFRITKKKQKNRAKNQIRWKPKIITRPSFS